LWKIENAVQFSSLMYRFSDLAIGVGRNGFRIDVSVKSLHLQFHYDLSDQELEKRLRFDMAFRWFCGFTAFEETPDHSFFCRFRKLVETKRMGMFFKTLVKRSKEDGIKRSVFRFTDATAIITKQTTWEERDKALKKGEDNCGHSRQHFRSRRLCPCLPPRQGDGVWRQSLLSIQSPTFHEKTRCS